MFPPGAVASDGQETTAKPGKLLIVGGDGNGYARPGGAPAAIR
jgi:hypothetical protein